ncbi:hypothetical protein LBMAG42_11120 [Deltaproteobacteria bacterium]|nr:hypothetical protein LBMAG42_11120 [Deltaproteobacteria bacterium]
MRLLFLLALGCDSGGVETGDTSDTSDTGDTSDTSDTSDTGDSGVLRTCDDIVAEFDAEAGEIRACVEAADCGRVLDGTSCGCTRDWVARKDADTGEFYALMSEAADSECELGLESTCDCPETAGYDCVDEVCTWKYVDGYFAYPMCEGADGWGFDVESVTLEGDEIVVEVWFSGGCATHWFTTCWPDQAFMESFPVQASLDLLHTSDEPDACDGYLYEEVRVDLVPLKAAYESAYGAGGTIVVHIEGESVEYSF